MTGHGAIELDGISHRFDGGGAGVVIDDITLGLDDGSFTAIIGPSGCGKSTLFRIMAGLVVPTAGSVTVGGVDVIGRPGSVVYHPQRDLLLPWRRVLANATLGADIAGVDADEGRRAALSMLDRFGLAGFERSWPRQLSGGMRQRLALLRSFLVPYPVLLLDEPLGALDAITRRDLHSWLQEVWQADRRTTVLITHDVDEALVLADRVVVMSARPGRIVADITVPIERPRRGDIVTGPAFVDLKAELLVALGG